MNVKPLKTIVKYASLLVMSFIILFPVYLVFINAFKTKQEYANKTVFQLPDSFINFDNFSKVFEVGHLGRAFLNIGIVIVLAIIGNVLIGTMVAYVLGRFEFKMKKVIVGGYALATMIPIITTQVATFKIITSLGLVNTYLAPVFLYIGADVLQIYIYLQFIGNIPYELDESAMIEGSSLFDIYRRIIFPLLAPATATVVILKTIAIYNDVYIPYLYMPKQELGVVSTSLMNFYGTNTSAWEVLSAGILLVMIPTVIFFLFMQRFIFSGITEGAVK